MGEKISICLLTEIDFSTFLLFPWKSFADFRDMEFFISRFQVAPSRLSLVRLSLQETTVISFWTHSIKLTCVRTFGMLGVEEEISSL